MIFAHLKIALRHFSKNRFYTFLNFFGLSLGLLISLYIATWVIDELNYDNYHVNSNRIYRVERDFNYNGVSREMPVTSFNYAKALQKDFPEIINSTRMYPREISLLDKNNIYRKRLVHFADSNFLEIFSFNLKKGNPSKALDEPNAIVLTEKAAQSFFGTKDVYGKTLKIKIDDLEYSVQVSGILEKIPDNTHFHPDIIVPLPMLKDLLQNIYTEWRVNIGYTYIHVNTDNISNIEASLPEFLLQHAGSAYKTILHGDDDINDAIELKLKKLTDIHLKSHLEYELETNGDIKNIYLLSTIAVLILLLAISNYVNLTNAKSEIRSLEIGIRKVVGSSKFQVVKHFFTESMILILGVFIFSIILLFLLAPFYEQISEKEFNWVFFDSFNYFSLILLMFFAISFLAGIYPALFISRFKILKSLKGKKQIQHSKINTKAILVVFQFLISIGLISFSLLMGMQIRLIQTKDIGFNKDNLIVIETDNPDVRNHFDSFREELLKIKQVEKVSSAGVVPVSQLYPSLTVQKTDSDEDYFFSYMGVNYDMIELFDIEIKAGRSYSREFSDTSEARFILNEKAAQLLNYNNYNDAINEPIKFRNHLVRTYEKGEIIGVVRNFNFKSLHNNIEPLAIQLNPQYLSAIFIKVNSENINQAIKNINNVWSSNYPEIEFSYSFLSDTINKQYITENSLQTKLVLSTLLAIIIGCIGLLGLSIYILQQKAKEIGVRKVNGASTSSLVVLFTKQYLKWISISALIACPTSFYLFKNWLNNFSDKINLNYFWLVFTISWLIVTIISLITVMGQTIKFSKLKPVEVLKDE